MANITGDRKHNFNMTNISARIFEMFKNLKSDAVPKMPRRETRETPYDVTEENQENVDTSNDQGREEIDIELEDEEKDYKPKKKEHKKKSFNFSKPDKSDKNNKRSKPMNSVNTQATGNVFNIVGSTGVHCGNVFINNFGPQSDSTPKKTTNGTDEHIEKTNNIKLLLEAKIRPEHEYIDYIAKNLGANWKDFFIVLGYTKGRIETFEYDEGKNGVSEARYKLLLDWARNDEDGTLGRLVTFLWEEGERQIVKELALMYKKNIKK